MPPTRRLLAALCAVAAMVAAADTRAAGQSTAEGSGLEAEIRAVAALPGEPSRVAAAGMTSDGTPLVTLEHRRAFDPTSSRRRVTIVAAVDGDLTAARLALDAVRWFKTAAPAAARASWDVSVLPRAGPATAAPVRFPPEGGFFNDPTRPDLRYVWRWVTYQVPDLVVELDAGTRFGIRRAPARLAPGSLAAALARPAPPHGLGPVATMAVTARPEDGARLMREILAAGGGPPSPLRRTIDDRLTRAPLAIARVLADRYPATPTMGYIAALAWVHTWRLGGVVEDPSLRTGVLRALAPWLQGARPLWEAPVRLNAVAGTMVFGEIAGTPAARPGAGAPAADTGRYREAAARLAADGVAVAAAETAPGIPTHGFGWSDDIFLGTVAAATANDGPGLQAAVRLIVRYAERLQQDTGLFHHAPDAPVAWGRGNGFAALGLAETLTAMPEADPGRAAVLAIYRRLMRALRTYQAPDGMWHQVVDRPDSYRETSVTALAITALARGLRLGWLDDGYRPVVTRAWRALLAHVAADGTLVDVCIGTGAGPTTRYYLHRAAVNGADDRGGALALGAALEMHHLRSLPRWRAP